MKKSQVLTISLFVSGLLFTQIARVNEARADDVLPCRTCIIPPTEAPATP